MAHSTTLDAPPPAPAPDPRLGHALAFSREILPAVSRTFALSIRVLPGMLGDAVNCAYLLCRIADTIEDAPNVPVPDKAALFDAMLAGFDDAGNADRLPAAMAPLHGEAAHLRLVHHADLVFVVFRHLDAPTREYVRRWVTEMVTGMRKFVLLYPAGIRIQTLPEYQEYCYYVAGTVGYLLTDLWRQHAPSIGDREYAVLRERSRAFAEALQTVNILKDVPTDAEQENSIYIPEQLLAEHGTTQATMLEPAHAEGTRAAMTAMIRLAWDNLEQARDYLLLLPRRAVSIRLFCALPLLFAYATLRDITRQPAALAQRHVVKISRGEVKTIIALTFVGVFSNRALAGLVRWAARSPVLLLPGAAP